MPLRDIFNNPRRNGAIALAGGLVKGAVVGLAIGKLGLGLAAGAVGGATIGAALAWRRRHAPAAVDVAKAP
jgi:hypothetical protein